MPALTEDDLLEYWVVRLQEFDSRHQGETDPQQLAKIAKFREIYTRRINELLRD